MGRVARCCAGRVSTPPELGTIGHFLQTAAHSKERQASSELIKQLRRLLRSWPHSDWLVSGDDSVAAIDLLTTRFRNPAAHTAELGRGDYEQALEFVAGGSSMLWELLRSTQASKWARSIACLPDVQLWREWLTHAAEAARLDLD
jgi:hypothetical protein